MNVHAARRIYRSDKASAERCAGVYLDEIAPRVRARGARWPSDQFVQCLAKKEFDGEISRAQLRKVLDVLMRRAR